MACPHIPAPPVGILCATLPFRTSLLSVSYVLLPNHAASPVLRGRHRHRHLCSRRRVGVAEGVVIISLALSSASLGGRWTQPCVVRWIEDRIYDGSVGRLILMSHVLLYGMFGVSWVLFTVRESQRCTLVIRNIHFRRSPLCLLPQSHAIVWFSDQERCVPVD